MFLKVSCSNCRETRSDVSFSKDEQDETPHGRGGLANLVLKVLITTSVPLSESYQNTSRDFGSVSLMPP